MTPRAGRARTGRGGFTLIELLAVLTLFGLIAGLILPRFSLGGGRAVRSEAEALGEVFEFARQSAIMTARPHHVVMDLDHGQHWVEWAPLPAPESEAVAAAAAERPAGSRQVDMTPPPAASGELVFRPIDGRFGRPHVLPDGVVFASVAFPDSTLDNGVVTIELGPDGAADPPAVVSLSDPEGSAVYAVELEPLADAVRVVDARR